MFGATMKRDMDLVRLILTELENSSETLNASVFTDSKHDEQSIAYHFEIMREAGLIESSVCKDSSGVYLDAEAVRLTWAGNDFLSAIRNEKIWKSVKLDIAKKLGDAPFSLIVQLAIKACSKALGL